MRKRKIIGIVVGVAMILAGGEEASAVNGWEEELKLVTASSTSQTTSSVSLSLSSGAIQTNLDAANAATNPDEAGKVLSQTATITVGNTDGYTVYISGNTNLTGRNNSSHKIPSISNNKTLGNMSNEWGYYATLGDSETSFNPNTSFKAMTTSQQSVGTGGATSSSVTKKLTLFYGARVNNSVVEDFYGNTITLSVVAQPRTITNTITTMQDFATYGACSRMNTHETTQLTDARDNKKYWVTKLLDGNCWMSQNLTLDITTNGLSSSSTDIVTNWTSSSTYPPQATKMGDMTGSTEDTGTYSWNLGEYVLNTPIAVEVCISGGYNGARNFDACSKQGFVKVAANDGWTASGDPNFFRATSYTGKNGSTCTKSENSAVNASASANCKYYDAHYLVGNYYQWNAATAGSGGTLSSTDASASVCPRGWRLPSANMYATQQSGMFAYLLQKYGLASSATSGTLTGTSPVNSYMYDIALAPLFFVRSGYLRPVYTELLYEVGRSGYYWSSHAEYGTEKATLLRFGSSDVAPSNDTVRYHGLPLRCLVSAS